VKRLQGDKMKITFQLLLFFLCLIIPTQAQNNKNKIFCSNSVWMLDDYYNGLMQGKMPMSLQPQENQILAVGFNNKSRELHLLSFHDCLRYKYKLLKRNLVAVLDNQGRTKCTLELKKISGMDRLLLNIQGKEMAFLHLPDNYKTIEGVFHFINDHYITGSYILRGNENSRITFSSDGKIKGFREYNEYSISLTKDAVPKDQNILVMKEIKSFGNGGKKIIKLDYFMWEKNDKNIFLYKLSGPTPNGKIQGKPLELVRTGS
jgi:hypothetical protein